MIKRFGINKKELARYYLSFGLIMVTISIFLNIFVESFIILEFLEGLLMGISIPLLIVGIYYMTRSTKILKKEDSNKEKN